MSIQLVVVNPFGNYDRGDRIVDPELVAEIRDSNNAVNVVPVAGPDFESVPNAPAAA